jgi:hypothetical protein
VYISSRCGGSGFGGLQFTTAGKFMATITANSISYKMHFEVYPEDFISALVRVPFHNMGQSTTILFEIKTNSLIPAGGKIRI